MAERQIGPDLSTGRGDAHGIEVIDGVMGGYHAEPIEVIGEGSEAI